MGSPFRLQLSGVSFSQLVGLNFNPKPKKVILFKLEIIREVEKHFGEINAHACMEIDVSCQLW